VGDSIIRNIISWDTTPCCLPQATTSDVNRKLQDILMKNKTDDDELVRSACVKYSQESPNNFIDILFTDLKTGHMMRAWVPPQKLQMCIPAAHSLTFACIEMITGNETLQIMRKNKIAYLTNNEKEQNCLPQLCRCAKISSVKQRQN